MKNFQELCKKIGIKLWKYFFKFSIININVSIITLIIVAFFYGYVNYKVDFETLNLSVILISMLIIMLSLVSKIKHNKIKNELSQASKVNAITLIISIILIIYTSGTEQYRHYFSLQERALFIITLLLPFVSAVIFFKYRSVNIVKNYFWITIAFLCLYLSIFAILSFLAIAIVINI